VAVESSIVERLVEGGRRVTERRSDFTIPIADFASLAMQKNGSIGSTASRCSTLIL